MMDAVWELESPWSWILLVTCLVILAGVVFWIQWSFWWRKSGRAPQIAAAKTLAWLVLYGGSFALTFWIVSSFMKAGTARYLVGGGVWWLLSQTVLALAWTGVSRILDNR